MTATESPRTFGTYEWHADGNRTRSTRGEWHLKLTPAVAIRAKRLFERATVGDAGRIVLAHTTEVCRDLEWFMERFPLLPVTEDDATRLVNGADEHRADEAVLASIIAGEGKYVAPPMIAPPVKTLRGYQQQSVDLLAHRNAFILTDEVGMGKTLTAAAAVNRADALPAVVVAPAHLTGRWADELRESLPHLRFEVAQKQKPPQHILGGDLPDITIVTYSKLSYWQHALIGKVRSIIGDEIQDLRGGVGTAKGAAFAAIRRECTYALGTTATPIYNDGGELWELANIITPAKLGTKYEFTREWGSQGGNNRVWVKDPAALGDYVRENAILFGHTRAEVGTELPDNIPVHVTADVSAEVLENAKGDAAAFARIIVSNSSSRKDRFQAAGELDYRLRQSTGIAKAPFVAEYVKNLLTMEKSAILFGWHRAVYDMWMEEFGATPGINPVLFSGSESPAQKLKAREQFISGESRLLIMSLRSGAGIDGLQSATSNIVFGELDWSPQVHTQGIGRARRDGMDTSTPVVVHWLVSEEGSDPVISEALGIKRNQSEPLMNKDGKLTTVSEQAMQLGRGQQLARFFLGSDEVTRLQAPSDSAQPTLDGLAA